MPRENKKFINPLLRPSQDVEAKPVPETKEAAVPVSADSVETEEVAITSSVPANAQPQTSTATSASDRETQEIDERSQKRRTSSLRAGTISQPASAQPPVNVPDHEPARRMIVRDSEEAPPYSATSPSSETSSSTLPQTYDRASTAASVPTPSPSPSTYTSTFSAQPVVDSSSASYPDPAHTSPLPSTYTPATPYASSETSTYAQSPVTYGPPSSVPQSAVSSSIPGTPPLQGVPPQSSTYTPATPYASSETSTYVQSPVPYNPPSSLPHPASSPDVPGTQIVQGIPLQPSTSPSVSPYTSSETSTYTQSPVPYTTSRQPYDYSYSQNEGRRRRGEQAFEKTHERITLWIDKRLKQAFEELAYQQEISKTALLNEAVADLLRKHRND